MFGFLINPPIVLYYSQGLNTTPIHAHAALFGVYGCLALALMLFAFREFVPEDAWDEKMLSFSFWSVNIGLVLMMVFGLIPNGFYQLVQSIDRGTWYARSAEVIASPWMLWTVAHSRRRHLCHRCPHNVCVYCQGDFRYLSLSRPAGSFRINPR